MSFREKAQIVVISVAIGLALAAGIYYYVAGPSLGPGGILSPTDDQPIIMAGGSFYIGTSDTATFSRSANDKSLEYKPGYRVFRIDVTDQTDKTVLAQAVTTMEKGRVDIVYCKLDDTSGLCTNQSDTVTLNFDNTVTSPVIKITNDVMNNKPIGEAPRIMPTLRRHIRRGWTMYSVKVTINSTGYGPYFCGRGSDCEAVVHTCTGTNCKVS